MQPEWRFARGWSRAELEDRLGRARRSEVSVPPEEEQLHEHGWEHYYSHAAIGHEPPGLPVVDGAFARARALVTDYYFSDPRIVVGHFDREDPLLGRVMLLELRVLGLRYLCGVVVGAVRTTSLDGERTTFGYRYDTLRGHVEHGSEWFLLRKDHTTGQVSFRIQANWQAGEFPNLWSRVGFALVARRYQRAWHRLAYLRLRALVGAPGLPPLPSEDRILHTGPALPAPSDPGEAAGPRPPVTVETELMTH